MRDIPSVVVMGVSGSGKTTVGTLLAKRLGVSFVDGDDLHPVENVEKMRRGVPLDDADRLPWIDAVAAELTAHPGGTVVACSALRRVYRDRIRAVAPATVFVVLEGAASLIEQRLRDRVGHFMPVGLLGNQISVYEPPSADESAIRLAIGAPPAALVDEVLAVLAESRAAEEEVRHAL